MSDLPRSPAARPTATVLITSPAARHAGVAQLLERDGWHVRTAPLGPGASEDEVVAALDGVDGVIAGLERYPRHVIGSAKRLQVISRVGVGYDNVDVTAATDHGVFVCTSAGVTDKTVAEFTVTLMLVLARQVLRGHENVTERLSFDRPRAVDFAAKTIGIVGTGAIGKQVALRVKAFECRILAFDVQPDTTFAASLGFQYVELDELLRSSDFVTVHVPLLPSTRNLIGAEQLRIMHKGAYLVNTARGAIVDEDALAGALRDKRLAGAALDVYATEPLPADSPLRGLDNVILTPHAAAITDEANRRMAELAAENATSILNGSIPPNCVNPQAKTLRVSRAALRLRRPHE